MINEIPSMGILITLSISERVTRPALGIAAADIAANSVSMHMLAYCIILNSMPYICAKKITEHAWKSAVPFMFNVMPKLKTNEQVFFST